MTPDESLCKFQVYPRRDGYLARWQAAAEGFRSGHRSAELGVAYGAGARQSYDMFHPDRSSKGTVVFVHGGYWLALGPRDFSHLAAGAVGAGYACAMPSYTLAPDARIGEITGEVFQAISAIAQRTVGPIYLVGHSAGGHLVARMVCADMAADWSGRIARVMPISGLSDLAPLMETSMNDVLGVDAEEASVQSPLHHEKQDIPVTVWVGDAERPAFLDQSRWLAGAWDCDYVIDPDCHHFDVIEGLENPRSAMMQALFSER